MPHHRAIALPTRRDALPHPELRAHYDQLYDTLLDGRSPRDARPLLDVGSADGTTLQAITAGTPLHAVAIDRIPIERWHGPPDTLRLLADAQRLPFADASFATGLMVDTFEWLRHPATALQELARVVSGPIVIVQSDWPALWFDSDDPDIAREFVRRWSDSSTASVKSDLKDAVAAAGMVPTDLRSVSIRATSLEPNALASDQLRAIRRWLVVERPAIRARRFDEWRRDLDRRAADHKFEMVLRRHICIARPADHIEWSAESDPHPR